MHMRRWRGLLVLFVLLLAHFSVHAGVLTLTCYSSKTAACDQAWMFDTPQASSTCTNAGDGYFEFLPFVTVTNGSCPAIITRTWTVFDYCGNTSSCSQSVTLIDTNPPAALCSGVNLVPNPSFEDFSLCPDFFSQTDRAVPWYPPTWATPDYFNTCAPTSLPISVPANEFGVQWPVTGQAYAGAILHRDSGQGDVQSYREYLQVKLKAPLIAGQSYAVAFYTSLGAYSPTIISSVGAHFSVGPIGLPFPNGYVLPATPQIVNPATNLIGESWTLVQGTYVAAGGETHLTLGNFLSDLATPFLAYTGTNYFTYYYFDDVSVVAICDPSVTGKTVNCSSPVFFDPPTGVDACSGTNVAVTVASTVTNNTCPLVMTRTWTLTDACGNAGSWSQTVTAIETDPPLVICECIADSAIMALNTNSCAGIVPDLSPYTHCIEFACGAVTITQAPPAGTVFGPGTYMITTRVESCSGNVSTCMVPFNVSTPVPVITTPGDFVVQTCSNQAHVSFAVSAMGSQGPVPVSCTPSPGPATGVWLPLGSTLVTCVATGECGGVATNTFTITVRPPRNRWICNAVGVGIGIGHALGGGSAIQLRTSGTDDNDPGIVVLPEQGVAGPHGITLAPGPADSLRLTIPMRRDVPEGGYVEFMPSASSMDPDPTPLLGFYRTGTNGVSIRAGAAAVGMFKAVAVDTNGNLFDAISFTAEEALTNDLLLVEFMNGTSEVHLDVEVNLRTGGASVGFLGEIGPSTRHKGWDGCIYGPDRPRPKPPKTARVIITPPVSEENPPMEELLLRFAGMPELIVQETSTAKGGPKYSDGHVTLMKAFDDGGEGGVDFTAAGPGGGVSLDIGHAASFHFRVSSFHGAEVHDSYQELRIIGWPPLTTTNRPPPPTNYLRLAASTSGSGVDVSADFSAWNVTHASMQLFNHDVLVGERPPHPAELGLPLVVISGFPQEIGVPTSGVIRLADEHGFFVSGMDCGGLPCIGDELWIVAERGPEAEVPFAFTGVDFMIAPDMDMRVSNVQTTLACVETPVVITNATGAVTVHWEGDGYRLQGAESQSGPWYDLGVTSPARLSVGAPLRVFRLLCD